MFVLLGIAAVAAGKALWENRDKIPDTGYDGEDDEFIIKDGKYIKKPVSPRRSLTTPTSLQAVTEIRLPVPSRPSAKAWSSPLAGVSDLQWQKFVRIMGDKSNVNSVSGSGHIGYFRFSCPRLQELGLAVNACRATTPQSGTKKVWQADLVDAGFLSSPRSQLRAFELSCGDLATKIKTENLLDVGTDIDGAKPSLSGLLAVAHRAGFKGLTSWLRNPADRMKYPNTTKAFREANAIF